MKNKAKVICPGESLIDFVCTDLDSNLVSGSNFIKKAGGAPANVAVAINKLGAQAYILGCVGNDQFGDFLIESVKKYEVNTDMLFKLDNQYTTLAFVSLTNEGERDFKFNRGADANLSYDMLDKKVLDEASVFHFGSATAFMEGALQDTYYKLLENGVKNEKIISFDPNYRDALFEDDKENFVKHCKAFIKHTDILKVSDEEAFIITGEKSIEKAASILNDLGAKYTIITLGKDGAYVSSKEKSQIVKSEPVKMVDATGAGDAFIGTIIAKVANSKDLSFEAMIEYVELANKVGAITVKKIGALESIPYESEI